MKTNKIIITVRGGTVQAVHTSPSMTNTEIVLLDYDELDAGSEFTQDQLAAEGEIENNQVIESL